MKEKRLQRVQINSEELERYFTGEKVVIEGLPDDATIYDMYNDPARNAFYFIFESDEFPVVGQGEEIPVTDIAVVDRRVNTSEYWVCPNCFETHENGDLR